MWVGSGKLKPRRFPTSTHGGTGAIATASGRRRGRWNDRNCVAERCPHLRCSQTVEPIAQDSSMPSQCSIARTVVAFRWRRCHRVAPASPAWHARFRRARCAGPDARHDRRCRCRALRSRRSCGCRDRGTDTNRTIAPVSEPAGTSHPQHQTSPGRVAMRVVGGRDRRGGRNLSEASAALTVGSDLVYRSSCSRR